MADVEAVLVAFLTAQFPGVKVCAELPATLPAKVIQVERIGGPDTTLSIDQATVDVECYANGGTQGRVDANALAYQVRDALRVTIRGYTALGATVQNVATISGPAWRPDANTTIRRVGATYQVTVHNHQ